MPKNPEPVSQCFHVRSGHVVPGWGCCKCRTYNGYQREQCRKCGHEHCYEIESSCGKEAVELAPIAHNADKMRLWFSKHQTS
jgi:hypothetical protein